MVLMLCGVHFCALERRLSLQVDVLLIEYATPAHILCAALNTIFHTVLRVFVLRKGDYSVALWIENYRLNSTIRKPELSTSQLYCFRDRLINYINEEVHFQWIFFLLSYGFPSSLIYFCYCIRNFKCINNKQK